MKRLLLSLILLTNVICALPPKPVLFIDYHYLIGLNETNPLLEMRDLYNKCLLEDTKNSAITESLYAELKIINQIDHPQKYKEILYKVDNINKEMGKKYLSRSEEQQQIVNKVKLYAEVIAKRHNACAVIPYDTNKIYIDPSYNITNEVSNVLNQVYLQTMTQKTWNPLK